MDAKAKPWHDETFGVENRAMTIQEFAAPATELSLHTPEFRRYLNSTSVTSIVVCQEEEGTDALRLVFVGEDG
ncbi:hypothetical protein, partial [Dongia sedimenti]|nr:hypothetical protein [Rhodospirillaceae bacterium R-7]